jgi:hypothetical protein
MAAPTQLSDHLRSFGLEAEEIDLRAFLLMALAAEDFEELGWSRSGRCINDDGFGIINSSKWVSQWYYERHWGQSLWWRGEAGKCRTKQSCRSWFHDFVQL